MVAAAGTGAPARSVALVATAAPLAVLQQPVVRPYARTDDYAEVARICKNVYGGTDYLPRVVEERAASASHVVLVAEAGPAPARAHCDGADGTAGTPGCGGGGGGQLYGIVCAEDRGGGTAFVSGLRVCEGVRGLGVGQLLMESVCAALERRARPPRALMSTTADAQATMVRMFARLGWRMRVCVELWPPSSALHEFEARIGWPKARASFEGTGSMLALLPGAQERLAAAAAPPGAWRRCECAAELAAAVASVRRGQAAWWRAHGATVAGGLGAGGGGGDDDNDGSDGMLWLPWVYDIIGVASDDARLLLSGGWEGGGGIWLLPAASEQGGGGGSLGAGSEFDAVVVSAPSRLMRRHCGGVLASGPAAVEAGAACVAADAPHFLCFVDQGARYWGKPRDAAVRSAWPGLYAACAAPSDSFYIYDKPLTARL